MKISQRVQRVVNGDNIDNFLHNFKITVYIIVPCS